MRIKQRYKLFSKNTSPLVCIPQEKLLKFHRPKWKKIQKKILKENLKKKLSKIKFKNYGNNCCSKKRWDRASFIFRNQLLFKRTVQILYFNSVTNNFLKKIFLKTKSNSSSSYLQTALYKAEYRIDILLFRLGFFESPFLAKYAVKNNKISLNKAKIHFLINLVKGDIIFITYLKKIFFKNKFKESIIFFSFLEIDYYTNKIIVIKDLQELNEKDFFLLTRGFYNILDLRDHLLS